MRNFLVPINLAILLIFPLLLSAQTKEYNLLMQIRENRVTSVCYIKQRDSLSIAGTVVNQMGVKAFDFVQEDGKVKVLNVVGPLNKWYIRKVLRKDFEFILKHIGEKRDTVERKRSIEFLENGEIKIRNIKHRIDYIFSPMQKEEDETD